jgi:hypothetical protein
MASQIDTRRLTAARSIVIAEHTFKVFHTSFWRKEYDRELGNKSLVDSILINLSQTCSHKPASSRTIRQSTRI